MVLSTSTSFSQDFGIKAGINFSTLSSEFSEYHRDIETQYAVRWHLGLVKEFSIGTQFSLQPELLYSREGGVATVDINEEDLVLSSEEKIKLSYLSLPIMLKFNITDGLDLEAGPQIAYLLGAENKYKISSILGGGVMYKESGTQNIKEEVKPVSVGLNLGLGYALSRDLFLQARYHLGLSNIDGSEENVEDEFEGDSGKIRNSGFQLSFGYRF